VPQGALKGRALISTATKTILYLVYNANKEGGEGALFDLNVDWILQSEKVVGRNVAGRYIDWVCIRRNKKREVVCVVLCERWRQMGLGYSTLLLDL
jgi:hypothetical protein